MNIRSNKAKYPIADKIAHHFQGGGHEERAGFPIPSEYGNDSENNQKMDSIPQNLIDEILKQVSFEVQALEATSLN
jgi:nanoRNase/pAp phosphatase (c-di-AMP/oligoRNAs hydrolase)